MEEGRRRQRVRDGSARDRGPPKVFLVARPGSVQTTLRRHAIGSCPTPLHGVDGREPGLGGTMGRLFRLREGYTYGIGSFSRRAVSRIVDASERAKVTDAALTDLLAGCRARQAWKRVRRRETRDRRQLRWHGNPAGVNYT
jgi:hypothetical protein